jgi:DNA-binding transcriptional MerR regulator
MDKNEQTSSSNGNGAIVPKTSRVAQLIDITSYPTLADVARDAGVAVSSARKWQRKGKITPIADAEGTIRFDPDEVELFLARRAELRELGEYDTGEPQDPMVQSLFQRPRERIDDLLFRLLDRYEAALERRDAILERTFRERETSKATTAEQELVAKTLKEETEMKAGLIKTMTNAVNTIVVPRLAGVKKNGAGAPTLDFLEEASADTLKVMLCLEDIFSEAEHAKILRVLHMKQRQAASVAGEQTSETPATPAASTEPTETSGTSPAESEK